MDAGLEARALSVLDELLERPPADRETWLATRCSDDPVLRERVARLLRRERGGGLVTGAGRLLDTPDEPPERIGPWRITGLIGRGGMGAVYRGERDAGDFEQRVAIKLIRPGALSDELVDRFRRERQLIARLAHSHIARLFDGGETETGQPWFVMEYVAGQPLGSWLADANPPLAARLALFRRICEAVAYAHRKLVIHRDLTPANILVDGDGAPKLIDFGIAQPLAEDAADATGETATPGYAPPERLAGAAATTLTDIYALGRLLRFVVGDDDDADLAAIAAKAAADAPARRYAAVDSLIDDLDRHRDGRAVAARDGGPGYHVGRFIMRHRLAVAAAFVALAMLVAALIVSILANRRAELARADAEARFAQTRSIAKTLLFDAFDEVRKASGGTAAQALLARTGLVYLDALAADLGGTVRRARGGRPRLRPAGASDRRGRRGATRQTRRRQPAAGPRGGSACPRPRGTTPGSGDPSRLRRAAAGAGGGRDVREQSAGACGRAGARGGGLAPTHGARRG